MFCNKCGNQVNEKFCNKCGNPMNTNENAAVFNGAPEKTNKKRILYIAIAASLVMLVCLSAGLINLVQINKEKTEIKNAINTFAGALEKGNFELATDYLLPGDPLITANILFDFIPHANLARFAGEKIFESVNMKFSYDIHSISLTDKRERATVKVTGHLSFSVPLMGDVADSLNTTITMRKINGKWHIQDGWAG